jgi:hypothetical protein
LHHVSRGDAEDPRGNPRRLRSTPRCLAPPPAGRDLLKGEFRREPLAQ